jgi:hypothetical protein
MGELEIAIATVIIALVWRCMDALSVHANSAGR